MGGGAVLGRCKTGEWICIYLGDARGDTLGDFESGSR